MRRALAALLPLALVAVTAAPAAGEDTLRAGVFSPAREAPDFSLRGSNGRPLTLRDYRGKVVILGFGFSSCPNVCPITLATLAQAHKALGAKAGEVQVLYVTVDPERDDAERLRTYLANFDPSFVGGTGSDAELAKVRESYGVAAQRVVSERGVEFSHSSYTYLIDREGRLRALMPYGHPPEDYVHDVGVLLAR